MLETVNHSWMGFFLTFLEAIAMVLKALLICNLVALLAMLGATGLWVSRAFRTMAISSRRVRKTPIHEWLTVSSMDGGNAVP